MLRNLLFGRSLTASAKKRRARANKCADGTEALEQRALLTVNFKFDYSLDTGNFFDTNAKKASLERAGKILTTRLNDTLDSIVPGGGNIWSALFTHPGTGSQVTRNNLTIQEDEILIFAGGRNMGSTLGEGGWGGFTWNGDSEWGETVEFRGEATNGTDFAPWGGSLAFNTTRSWHFGNTVEGLDNDEFDFTTVALHELGHALGFAPNNAAYDRYVSGSTFRGPRSVAEYDGPGNVPLHTDNAHWAINLFDEEQRTLMDPSISAGTRELPTYLDWAAIDDIGWDFDRLVVDYGDAPGTYPTTTSQNGARHNLRDGLYLGTIADGDSNGQGSDDSDDGFDDEDGVRFLDTLYSGSNARVDVTANREGTLNAWFDFNVDGDWDDPGEHVFDDVDLTAGSNRLTFDVPDNANSGQSWARFRLNSTGNLAPTGLAADGEVEDYAVNVVDGILAIDDTASVAAGTSSNLDVTNNDVPSSRAQILGFTQPATGSVSLNGDQLEFTAPAGSSGTAVFDYTVGLAQQQYDGNGEGDELGRAVASFEDTLVLGAPLDDTAAGQSTGSVRIYRRDGLDWDLVQTITANDEQAGDRFGFSVSVNDNTLVIGSRGDDDDGLNSGSVYVYTRNDATSNFTFAQKLNASSGKARDQFGFSVAVEDNTLIVGVRMDDEGGTNSGSIEYFSRADTASGFEFVSRVQPEAVERGDQFGASLALDGNRLFVGARKDNNARTNAGAVYFMTRSGGEWNVTQTILPSKAEDNGYFGWSVSVSGTRLAVGQPARERITRTGRVFVHEQNEGGTNNWGVTKQIDPDAANGANRFGFSVSISGNNLLVGAPRMFADGVTGGDARLYQRNTGGSDNWGRERQLTADNAGGGDEYGYSVLVAGDQLFVGARLEDTGARNSGAFYVDDLRTDIGRVVVTIT